MQLAALYLKAVLILGKGGRPKKALTIVTDTRATRPMVSASQRTTCESGDCRRRSTEFWNGCSATLLRRNTPLLWMADKLQSDQGEHARKLWAA